MNNVEDASPPPLYRIIAFTSFIAAISQDTHVFKGLTAGSTPSVDYDILDYWPMPTRQATFIADIAIFPRQVKDDSQCRDIR